MTDLPEPITPRTRRGKPAAAGAIAVLAVAAGVVAGLLLAASATAQSPPWQTTVVSLSPSAPLAPPAPRDAVSAPAVPVVPAPGSGLKFKPGSVPRYPARLPPAGMAPTAVAPNVTGAIAPAAAAGAAAAAPSAAATGAPAAAPPKADAAPTAPTAAPIVIRRPAATGREDGDLVEQYCAQVGDIAGRTRTEVERRSIVDMTEQLDKRISLLEQKTAEHKAWLAKREQFLANAQESLVRIYTRMKSEAAAPQLAAMDETSAAAIVAKMEPKMASAILSDMDPVKAARLTSIIAGAAEIAPAAPTPERSGAVR